MSSNAFQPHEVGLRNRCRGTVLGPRDEGYDQARGVFNLTTAQSPALIAFPQDAAGVAAAVRYAAARGLRVAPRRTGHNAGPLPDLGDTLLLRTDGLQGGEIDAGARRAPRGGGGSTPPRAPAAPGPPPARAGGTSSRRPRRTAWPRCTARPR